MIATYPRNQPLPPAARRRRRVARRGLSLVEALISVGIAATLLTATAGAFMASSQAVANNEKTFRASRAARVSVNHLTSEIRRASAVQMVDSNTLEVITPDLAIRRYQYSPTTRELKVYTLDIPDDPDYVLAREVSALTFAVDQSPDRDTNVLQVVRATVDLTVAAGDAVVRISGAASPRRTREY